MLISMTGFGAAAGPVDGVEYAVEVRSVNNRYLKTVIKLPESWSHAEAEFEKLLRGTVTRGTVTLSVRMRICDAEAAYRVNVVALSNYIEQLKPLSKDANPMLRVDLGSMMMLPGVCEPPKMEELCERTHDGLMELVNRAITGLVDMRTSEGQAVHADLLANCDIIEQNLTAIAERSPLVVREYHERLTARVQELTSAARLEIDADSLAREVAIYADRCDIAEEISRLTGHLEQFRQATDGDKPAGRKLDFITQEMLREANTIGSKSNDTDIARAVVDIKTAVDRLKEQVQNVE